MKIYYVSLMAITIPVLLFLIPFEHSHWVYLKSPQNTKFGLLSNKKENLAELKKTISCIKNCELKSSATNLVFSDGNPFSKIMIIGSQ